MLVADDQPANLMVLHAPAGKSRASGSIAVHSGEEVLSSALESEHFDAVIIDLHMPGISGLDVLKQVRVMQAGAGAHAVHRAQRRCDRDDRARMRAGRRARVPDQAGRGESTARCAGRYRARASEADAGRATDRGRSRSRRRPEPIISRNVLEELAELQLGDGFIGLFIDECLRDALKTIGELESSGTAATGICSAINATR